MTTDWSANVYSQERKVVKITNFNNSTSKVRLSVSSPITLVADYVIPTSRILEIDVTDIVRLSQTGTINFAGYNSSGGAISGETASCFFGRAGLVNPANDIIPRSDLLEDWGKIADAHQSTIDVTLAPPSRILEQVDGQKLYVEMRNNVNAIRVYQQGTTTQLQTAPAYFEVPENVQAWTIENIDGQCTYGSYGVTKRDECRNYCVVRWTPRYGSALKQLVWEYRDLRVKVSDIIDIETINGGYDERKGYVQCMTLYLDELNAYDYWYYSDIVTSPMVEVYIAGAWIRVQVESKDAQVPNSDTGKLNKLEVKINIRKYDAV